MNSTSLTQTFARIRSNKFFESFVIFIIIFSALVIGAKTFDISPRTLWLIHALDWLITGIFLIEIIIRFLAEERKRDFFKQGWNIFDSLIVIMSLIPIEDSELALVGRLIRIFRVLRMVSIIPELKILLNSLLKAMPQLGYIIALMFIIFYIYAAVGSTFFASINEELWGDIAISMLTLFRVMTFEDWTDVQYETMEVYPLSWMYYLSFIFFTAFAFLNMVIGVVVNVLNEEHEKAVLKNKVPEPSNTELQEEIRALRKLLEDNLKQNK